MLVPSIGANLVKLQHKATGCDILRTPSEEEAGTFTSRPQIFGLPLLFPPNRIADGKYTFEGRKYQYPITIPAQNNYHHGIIKSQPFTVTECREEDGAAEVEASFFSNEFNDAVYGDFPHRFECRMRFRLSSEGLEHTVTFVNMGNENMPLGVGYHTPIRVPFVSGGNPGDYRLRLSVGERWELDSRTLPTGKLLPLTPGEQALRGEGIVPLAEPIESAFTSKAIEVDGKPYLGAVVIDTRSRLGVFYETDDQMRHWTLWNNGASVDWVCPEPQSWAINAPNLNMPHDVTGFRWVAPGSSWSSTSRLYVKPV